MSTYYKEIQEALEILDKHFNHFPGNGPDGPENQYLKLKAFIKNKTKPKKAAFPRNPLGLIQHWDVLDAGPLDVLVQFMAHWTSGMTNENKETFWNDLLIAFTYGLPNYEFLSSRNKWLHEEVEKKIRNEVF